MIHNFYCLPLIFYSFDIDDERKIILEDQSKEEIIIDEILSMPIDSVLTVPKIPDRLLSPLVTRHRDPALSLPGSVEDLSQPRLPGSPGRFVPSSSQLESVPLPAPLGPPYLPTKPVTSVWSRRHTTERLYRYTHFERIVYPHERIIMPPALYR